MLLNFLILGGYRHLLGTNPNPGGGSDIKDKLIFDTESFGLGYQLSDDHFGLGAELQYQFYYTKAKLTLPEMNFKDVQKIWATKLYLMLILEGSGSVTAVIEPYYILPTKGYNAQPIQEFMEVSLQPSQNKWTRFGLSFLFYNGFPIKCIRPISNFNNLRLNKGLGIFLPFMAFKITSTYQPTGDQPEAIRQLVRGIRQHEHSQVLLGVTGQVKRSRSQM
jgi:hypothetical protein